MPYATESDIRIRFQIYDTVMVPSDLVTTCLDEAHRELLRFLDPVYDETPTEAPIITGEVLLAGARVFRAVAAKDAMERQDLQIGSHRIRPSGRADALAAIAVIAEKDAWYLLEPYLLATPAHMMATVTHSTPIFDADDEDR